MASYFLKEAPKVEILHAAITMDVVTGSALAQANEAQSIRIRSGVFHSSKQIIEVSESDLCKLGKIVWHDPLERTMRRIAHCSFPTFAGTPSAGWNGVRPAPPPVRRYRSIQFTRQGCVSTSPLGGGLYGNFSLLRMSISQT